MPKIAMLPSELQELMADVARVKLQDVHLGRALEKIVTHLAHAHDLDPAAAPEEAVSEEEEASDDEDTTQRPVVTTTKGKGR